MRFLPLKFSHYPSRPVPVPELFCKYPTRPVPKSKTPTRRTLLMDDLTLGGVVGVATRIVFKPTSYLTVCTILQV